MTALLLLAFMVAVRAVSASQSFVIAPPPSWVKVVAMPQSDDPGSATETVYILLDHQIRVSDSTVERYQRRIRKVCSAAALSEAAQIEIEFEPSYQQLTIHYVHILRGAQTIDVLRPHDIKVIQQEDELDQQVYNGRLSALIVLNDVRVGDVLDYAYTINGDNPVLAGRYVATFWLAATEPVKKLRWRLIWPNQRTIHYRAHGAEWPPVIRRFDAESEYLWERDNVAAVPGEDDAPSWHEPLPCIRLSEFATWRDVVNWALPLYKLKNTPAPALARQIGQWRTQLSGNEERLLAALQFVQDGVRYTGIEMGPYSHLPNQPSLVFERRFGDCKDKSLLLTTILNALNIEAFPALVNTDAQQTVAEFQPSPYAFDHVIVQAKLDGHTYWLDPTITLQRGSLRARYNPGYRRALIIRDGNGDLAEIPESNPVEATTVVKEVYTVEAHQQSALFDVTTTYRATDADAMRYELARTSLPELGRMYVNYYADKDPNIEQLATPSTRDDPNANEIVITEKYRIPQFWHQRKRDFYAHRIREEMTKPNITRRTAPLAISHPVSIAQSIEVHLPELLSIPKDSTVISDDFIRCEFRVQMTGNTVKLDYSYRSLADEVPASRVASHLAVLERARNLLSYSIEPASDSRGNGNAAGGMTGLAVLSLVFGLVLTFGAIKGVKSLRLRKRRQEFKDKFEVAPGTTPEAAIPLSHESEMPLRVGSLRCACGEPYY